MKKRNKKLFVSLNNISLAEGRTSKVEILRAMKFYDRKLEVTLKMLTDMVKHFEEDIYGQGQDIPVNLSHDRDGEAAGWIRKVWIEENSLMGEIEWTPLGEEKLKKQLFKFISIEFATRLPRPSDGKPVSNVLIGAALTNIPAMKYQQPIALSENINQLLNNSNMNFKLYLQNLSERAFVLKEDKEFMKAQFNELSEEEQAEVKEEVAEVEAKPEAPATEEKTDEEKEAEAKEAEEKAKAEEEEGAKAEQMSEIVTKQSETIASLSEQVTQLTTKNEAKELSEVFDKELALSESKPVGFRPSAKDKVTSFMTGLSEAKRNEFKTLLAELTHVDLSVKGGNTPSPENASLAQKMAEADKEAKKRVLAEKRPLHEVLSEVYVEMGIV